MYRHMPGEVLGEGDKIRFLEDENRKLRAQNAVKGIPEIRIVV